MLAVEAIKQDGSCFSSLYFSFGLVELVCPLSSLLVCIPAVTHSDKVTALLSLSCSVVTTAVVGTTQEKAT